MKTVHSKSAWLALSIFSLALLATPVLAAETTTGTTGTKVEHVVKPTAKAHRQHAKTNGAKMAKACPKGADCATTGTAAKK